MRYTAWIAHDDGARRDCRTVTAHRIDLLRRRMASEARDLLETYYGREKRGDGITYRPLPLVAFMGDLDSMAHVARAMVIRHGYTAAENGDIRYSLPNPLTGFHATVRAER